MDSGRAALLANDVLEALDELRSREGLPDEPFRISPMIDQERSQQVAVLAVERIQLYVSGYIVTAAVFDDIVPEFEAHRVVFTFSPVSAPTA